MIWINWEEIMDSGDVETFKDLFEKCEIIATNRGKNRKRFRWIKEYNASDGE